MWSIMIDCWDSLWLWLVWVKNAKSIFLVTHGGAKSPSCLSYKPGKNLFQSLGAGALVLLLGLLSILFYKCYIVIDDRRQYARQVLFHLQLKLCVGIHFSQNLSKMQIPTRIYVLHFQSQIHFCKHVKVQWNLFQSFTFFSGSKVRLSWPSLG